jgi:hypothetical protein
MDWLWIGNASDGFLNTRGPADYCYSVPPYLDSTLVGKVLADHAKVESWVRLCTASEFIHSPLPS